MQAHYTCTYVVINFTLRDIVCAISDEKAVRMTH